MSSVLICGLGEIGSWALEFLARSPGVDRIITMRSSAIPGPSRATFASVGAVFQDRLVRCEHVRMDMTDVATTASFLQKTQPDAILNSATMLSPRGLVNADVDPVTRAILRRATFGMWLPCHLLLATRLTEAVREAKISTRVVNAAFPDVVNPVIWKRFGYGPDAGAGNAEVSAAMLTHYLASTYQRPLSEIKVALVASHAFFTHGPSVPHLARTWVREEEVTDTIDVGKIVTSYPEPIDWRKTSTFSVFAAAATANIISLLSGVRNYTHMAAPNGLPGSYPVHASAEGIDLALPSGVTFDDALKVASAGYSYNGIDRVENDGTVIFTAETIEAMAELGYDGAKVRFDELEDRVKHLNRLFIRITG